MLRKDHGFLLTETFHHSGCQCCLCLSRCPLPPDCRAPVCPRPVGPPLPGSSWGTQAASRAPWWLSWCGHQVLSAAGSRKAHLPHSDGKRCGVLTDGDTRTGSSWDPGRSSANQGGLRPARPPRASSACGFAPWLLSVVTTEPQASGQQAGPPRPGMRVRQPFSEAPPASLRLRGSISTLGWPVVSLCCVSLKMGCNAHF